MSFKFTILHQSTHSRARVGIIETAHGTIHTPTYVPVGTNGALKNVIDSGHADLIFCNSYHLFLQPGTKMIKEAGGLHNFIGRNRPIITDSGGFQVFSLAYGSVHNELKSHGQKQNTSQVLEVTEEGVRFQSYRDGKTIFFSPEISVQAQKDLGADIIIPFDELLPYHVSHDQLNHSCSRTYRWEKRSLDYHLKQPLHQAMYGVIHGGVDPALRKLGCEFVTNEPFDGFAIGGSLGKNLDDLIQVLEYTMPHLPIDYPCHLLGIGEPRSIPNVIQYGIDSFDSAFPTKVARHGLLLTSQGLIKIRNARFAQDYSVLDPECSCSACSLGTSKAYLRHLFKSYEPNAGILASIHNLHYMQTMMSHIRQLILENKI